MAESSRASTSDLASIPSDELDAYIANLIVQKSQAKQARSRTQDISAYLEDDEEDKTARVPSTNKRFLASVIQNVEGHNRALLRKEAREAKAKLTPVVRGKGKQRANCDDLGGSSKLRAWSDDERMHEESGMSSKMDHYFEEEDDMQASKDASRTEQRSRRIRETDKESHSRPSHRHGDGEEDRRHKRHREGESSHGSESHHRSRSSHESHRSSHKKHRDRPSKDDRPDQRERRTRERDYRSGRKERDEASHRSRRDRDRSASPTTRSPLRKVREWDLGKDSLAF